VTPPETSGGDPTRTVVALAPDLLFSSRIGETARRLGYRFRAARSLDDLRGALAERPALVMVDLTAPGVDLGAAFQEIEAAGRPAPVLGWTTHASWKATKPRHAACDRVVTRETLTEELPKLLTEYVERSRRAAPVPDSGAPSSAPTT
jgi:DNA-binding NtrC family response regulator